MSREYETWFGFNLSQNQAVWIFILSLIGVIGSSFTLFTSFYQQIILIFTSSFYTFEYFFQIMIRMLPMFILTAIFLAISAYSLIKTRKIAKYYSQHLNQPSSDIKK